MLERPRQYALAKGVASESEIAAHEALAGLDPLVRALVRRQVRKLMQRVERETASSDPGHRLRLAYLFGAGTVAPDPDDLQAVRRLVLDAPAPEAPGRKGPWLTGALAMLLVLSAAGVFGLRHLLRPFDPHETPEGQLLGHELPHYVALSSRSDRAGSDRARARLLGEDSARVLGTEAVASAGRVLSSADALLRLATENLDERRQAFDEFGNAVTDLDRRLATRGLPYFVDAEQRQIGARVLPIPMVYYVQRESRAQSGGARERVLRLWRLDALGVRQPLLGFTRARTPAALILLDQVESDLIQFTLPAAAENGKVELTDDETREKGEKWALELEAHASKAMSAHYRSLGGNLARDARRIGSLLSRRRELVRKWAALLRGQGLVLAVPKHYIPEVDYAEELRLRVPRADREEWDVIHAELGERLPGFEELRDRFVRGVERHEVQHRLDYARGLIPVPPFLCRLLGLENPLDAVDGSLAARAREEASAYLAEIARPGDSPLLDLVILAQFTLDRRHMGSPYTFAALEVYQALGVALGVDGALLLGDGVVSRPRIGRLVQAVWQRSPDEIREAAARAYATEYGQPLPEVSFEELRANPYYRPH